MVLAALNGDARLLAVAEANRRHSLSGSAATVSAMVHSTPRRNLAATKHPSRKALPMNTSIAHAKPNPYASLPRKMTEIVLYQLKPGVSDAAFLGAVPGVLRFLHAQRGFISHRLLHDPADGRWVDLVEWASRLSAEQAAHAAKSSPDCAPAFELIDPRHTTLLHLDTAI